MASRKAPSMPRAWDIGCSGRRTLVARGQSELTAAHQASIVGACGFAAFYRKAALELVGGFCPQLGPAQADVDLALSLRSAGLSVAVEPQSRVVATGDVDGGESPFARDVARRAAVLAKSDGRRPWSKPGGPRGSGGAGAGGGDVPPADGHAIGRPGLGLLPVGQLRPAQGRADSAPSGQPRRTTGQRSRADRSLAPPGEPQ